MIAKDLNSGKTGWFAQSKLPEGIKKELVFPMVITICYLLRMFTRKWIKDLPTVKIMPFVHPGYIWPLSPRETKHEAYPVGSGDLWRSWQYTMCPCGQDTDACSCKAAVGYFCQVPCWVAASLPLSPSAMIGQERQSDSSLSKCKNSKCKCCI